MAPLLRRPLGSRPKKFKAPIGPLDRRGRRRIRLRHQVRHTTQDQARFRPRHKGELVMDLEALKRAIDLKTEGSFSGAQVAFDQLCNRGEMPLACWHYGEMLEKGMGMSIDQESARRLYAKAACLGDEWFKHSYARYLERQHDSADAFRAIEQLAMDGYPPSIFRLGVYYERGFGVEIDLPKSKALIDRAAALGHVYAQRHIVGKQLRGEEGFLGVFAGIAQLAKGLFRVVSIGSKDPWDPRLVN